MPESRVKVVNAKKPSSKPALGKQRNKKAATPSKFRAVKSPKQTAKPAATKHRTARKTSAAHTSVQRVPTPDEAAALRAFARAQKELERGRFAHASLLFRAIVEKRAGDSKVTARARIYLAFAEARRLQKYVTPPKEDAKSNDDRGVIELHRGDAQEFKKKFDSAVRRSKLKSFAGSSLTQARNPRSGHFVKIDKASGTILSHKKSRGAYKGVPIVETSSKQK